MSDYIHNLSSMSKEIEELKRELNFKNIRYSEIIDTIASLNSNIKKLQSENKKLREALGRSLKAANFFSSHADCQRDSWACKCSFCKNSGLHCKEIRDSEKILNELEGEKCE